MAITYENAVIRNGSAVVRTGTNVALVDMDVSMAAPDTPNWGGRLLPPNNTGLRLGHQYTLALPGFTPARIVITEEPDPNGAVAFRGVGAVPRSTPMAHPRQR
jgi:hypothetical protein